MPSSWARRKAILLASLFLMTYFFAIMIPEAHSLDIYVNPATRSVSQGSTATFTVTVPYMPCIPPDCATITLTSQPYYSGIPVTFSPSQYTFTATHSDFISTMSANVGPSVPPGSYNIDIIATSDKPVETKSATVWVEVTTLIITATIASFQTDWALSNPTISPAHPGVGDRVAFGVTLTALSSNAGYPQTVRFTFALDGTHVFFDYGTYDYPGPTGNPVQLEAGIDPREVWLATSGSHVVEWTVEPVGLMKTDPNTVNNHVSLPFSVGPTAPAFDFTLSVSPTSVTVKQGDTAHYMVQVTYSDPSYAGTVIHIQVAGLGPGMDWDLAESGDLAITTGPATPTGTYTITATGSAMGVTHQASAALIVTAGQPPPAQFDFGLSISPMERAVSPGGSGTYTVTVNLVAGSAQDVALSLSGPADMMAAGILSGAFNPSSGRPDPAFSSTLMITTGPSIPSGRFSLTVTGSGGGRVHTATFDLVVLSASTTATNPPSPPQTVTMTATTAPPLVPGFPDLTWITIGILAVLIVIFAALALRRRQPAYQPTPPAQPTPPTAAEKPKPSSLYCVNCGTENPSTNEFCGKCGEKLLRRS
jgi:ribosomal protein L40E